MIPEELLRDLYVGLARVEEVLATLEELMDKEGLKRIRKAEEEYKKENIKLFGTAVKSRDY
jgi:hypothetical protein